MKIFSKIKLSPFLKNIVGTTAASALVILSMIFVTRFLAQGFGPEEFGAYSLARRVVATVAPLVILSMDVGLSRYIAMTDVQKTQGSYIVSSLVISGAAMLMLAAVALVASGQISYLIFHSRDYVPLYYASLFMLGGYVICVIVSASLFGMQQISRANMFQIFFMAVSPLAIAFFFAQSKSSVLVVFLIGLVYYLAFLYLMVMLARTKWSKLGELGMPMKVLLKYGIPRTPAGFALAGLFMLGPFLASYFGTVRDAGFFVIGQYVFRIMESAIVAFGLVALPKIAQLVARGDEEFLKTNIENILIMIFQLGLFATIHTFLWSKEVLLVWLGPEYVEAVPVMKLLILSLGPYLGYVMLRSVVDAVEVRAINTLNLFISLGAAVIASLVLEYAGLGIIGLAIGTTIGFSILGILTGSYLVKRYAISLGNFMFLHMLVVNLLLAVIAIITKQYIAPSYSQYSLLSAGFVVETLLFSSYLYYLYKRDVSWTLGIKRRIWGD